MLKSNKTTNLIKIIIIVLSIIISIVLINKIIARLETVANSTANVQTAFYLIDDDYQSMTVNLEAMEPRDSAYLYSFSISNNDGVNRTETALEYDLSIITTTNLPLTYKLYLNGDNTNIFNNSETIIDECGTYFRKMTTEKSSFGISKNETNVYTLSVEFPSTYKQTEEYKDIIESIEIEVISRQVIEE